MQASITHSPLPTKFTKFRTQSYSNTNQTISSKQNPIFHQTKPCSHLTLRNFQPQSPLNLSTLKSPKISISNLGPLRCGISSNSESANVGTRSFRQWVELAGEAISTAFPLWVTIGCVLGLLRPNSFNWVTPKLSIVGLSVIMLGMGMTLTLDDLRSALSMPKEVLSGFFLQYSVSIFLL
jgi:BASS family bile acid:Na+ symporter